MRKISVFKTAKSQWAEELTHRKYLDMANDKRLLELCQRIAATEDKDERGELKKKLPAITWQASFPKRRLAKEAIPSGLFMLDIDHVKDPWKLYSEQICKRCAELGIVLVQKTASCHGLRIVAVCREGLKTLEECQRWLASNLKVEYDDVCKDFSRCSFMVHDSYTYFMDGKRLWTENAAPGTIYENPLAVNKYADMEGGMVDLDFEHAAEILGLTPAEDDENGDQSESPSTSEEPSASDGEERPAEEKGDEKPTPVDQREGLFGGVTEYKGVPLQEIAIEWLKHTGGEPEPGRRNNRLYGCALALRYICDFNEATLVRVLPRYGLPEEEIKTLVHSACTAKFGRELPIDLEEVLEKIDKRIKLQENDDDQEIPEVTTDASVIPPLPPVFRQWAEVAPADFKAACVLANLPILGALGSRLRAEYLDGKLHSPSFQVSLEAPQASGKSFVAIMVDYELAQMLESDEAQRAMEKEYNDKVAEMKLLNIKINADNKDSILGNKPKTLIRYLPATISITKLFQRMDAAQGLHTFCYAPEIDTVRKAHARGFSNLSDLLRMSFDNDMAGQDYASENSFSGNVRVYYNCIYTGTPKAMRKFYPDIEDGLVSRVLFVTLPDQFGKPMPVWGEFTPDQKRIVDIGLTRLNEVTLHGSDVQPEHEMKMDFLNKAMQQWILAQQVEAVNTNDRTRDVFCRRAAVVGFRAGMLANFLYEEKRTPTIRKNITRFAIWVANSMLNQHLLRFNVEGTSSNINRWEDVLGDLPNEFTRADVEKTLGKFNVTTSLKQVLYKWKLAGLIETMESGRGRNNHRTDVKFKKIKR